MAPRPAEARRSRWAISFADLLLLLMGFFVILYAGGNRRDVMLGSVSRQFGGKPMSNVVEVHAAELFVPGEAMLTDAGVARLQALARRFGGRRGGLDVASRGTDPAHQRYDDWDLAAARLGAVARALKAQGIGGDRLRIRGLDEADGQQGKGQVIRIAPRIVAGPAQPS